MGRRYFSACPCRASGAELPHDNRNCVAIGSLEEFIGYWIVDRLSLTPPRLDGDVICGVKDLGLAGFEAVRGQNFLR